MKVFFACIKIFTFKINDVYLVNEILVDMKNDWNPHFKLEFLKVAIRTAIKEVLYHGEAHSD